MANSSWMWEAHEVEDEDASDDDDDDDDDDDVAERWRAVAALGDDASS